MRAVFSLIWPLAIFQSIKCFIEIQLLSRQADLEFWGIDDSILETCCRDRSDYILLLRVKQG